MTDGVQRIFGMEYRPIKNLEVLAPAGLKVAYLSQSSINYSLFSSTRFMCFETSRLVDARDQLFIAFVQVVISNVSVRRGLLMLVPEAFEVLGGLVEELEAARKRLVDEVNKPPRGSRYY